MSMTTLIGGLLALGELLSSFTGFLPPQFSIPSIAITIAVTIVIHEKK